MWNNQDEITERIEYLKTQLERIQKDFRNNLKPKLLSFGNQMITPNTLNIIQNEIYCFLDRNNLKINVEVLLNNQKIVVFGRTLIDELVWENIQ